MEEIHEISQEEVIEEQSLPEELVEVPEEPPKEPSKEEVEEELFEGVEEVSDIPEGQVSKYGI